jgi:hypothetical protein
MEDQPEEARLTAYCGLYCADCIPARSALYSAARILSTELEKCHFEAYAPVAAGRDPAFSRYPAFSEVLQAIIRLERRLPCREGGCKEGCVIRACAKERGYSGCWECRERTTCPRLAPLLRFHPHLAEHLDLISEHGMTGWQKYRKGHYPWDR